MFKDSGILFPSTMNNLFFLYFFFKDTTVLKVLHFGIDNLLSVTNKESYFKDLLNGDTVCNTGSEVRQISDTAKRCIKEMILEAFGLQKFMHIFKRVRSFCKKKKKVPCV